MFEAGKSGNPNGRPKGTGKKQSLVHALQDYLADKEGDRTRLELAMERLYRDDLRTFMAYAYGKPVETSLNLNTENNSPEAVALALARLRLVGVSGQPEDNQNAV